MVWNNYAETNNYSFSMSYVPKDMTPEEREMVDRYTGYIANFIRTGKPAPDKEWEPYTKGKARYVKTMQTYGANSQFLILQPLP